MRLIIYVIVCKITLADAFAENIKSINGAYQFNVVTKSWKIENVQLNMGGMHNVENAVAAIAIAGYLNIDPEKIKNAVSDFKGVKRRFEYIIKTDKIVFIDDYAHHPEELKALITSAKSLFNKMKMYNCVSAASIYQDKGFCK